MKKNTSLILPLVLLIVILGCSSDKRDYEKAMQANTIQVYEEFIRKHPDSRFVEQAKGKIDSLEYATVGSKKSIDAYEEFLLKHPNSVFVEAVKVKLDSLRYGEVKSRNSIAAYKEFLAMYPNSRFYSAAVDYLKELHFKGVSKCDGIQVEVSFIYNAIASTITGFKATHACTKGSGEAEWQAKVTIKLQKDGSFYYKDKYDNFVRGAITSGGKAHGELSELPLSMVCGGTSYPGCTKWETEM